MMQGSALDRASSYYKLPKVVPATSGSAGGRESIKQEIMPECPGTAKPSAQCPVTPTTRSSARVSASSPGHCIMTCASPQCRTTAADSPVIYVASFSDYGSVSMRLIRYKLSVVNSNVFRISEKKSHNCNSYLRFFSNVVVFVF